MNPGRFFMPRIGAGMSPMMGASYLPSRGSVGLFGRIANSLRSFNWGGLLNGANKTLNVVNQTIPLVRQAGPMFNNMRSMLRLAKVFGNETNNKVSNGRNNSLVVKDINIYSNNNDKNSSNNENLIQKKEVSDENYPNFFV